MVILREGWSPRSFGLKGDKGEDGRTDIQSRFTWYEGKLLCKPSTVGNDPEEKMVPQELWFKRW